MFAIKSLPNLVGDDGTLLQGPQTPSFEKLGDGNGIGIAIANAKENKDEDKSEEMTECRVEDSKLHPEVGKIEVEKEKDDDSTAAISESSSSSCSHARTEMLTENAVISPPPASDKNNNIASKSKNSDDSTLVASIKLEEDVNNEEGEYIEKEGEDSPVLVQKNNISVIAVENNYTVPSETEKAIMISSSAIDTAVLETGPTERDALTAPNAYSEFEKKDAQMFQALAAPERNSGERDNSQVKAEDAESDSDKTATKENAQSKVVNEVMIRPITMSNANIVEIIPEQEDQAGLTAGNKLKVVLETDSDSSNIKQNEVVSKEVVTETPDQLIENCMAKLETKKEGKDNLSLSVSNTATEDSDTPPLTLAQRMKEMFDSSSPDQPSNAFGKSIRSFSVSVKAPKSVSVANDMKQMFDSPSLDEPSRAFGVGKAKCTTSIVKLHCKTDISVQKKEPTVETTKPTSPTSVADQMVSMLWVSSSSPSKKALKNLVSTKQGADEKNSQESNRAVIRETVTQEENEIDEDIEEITVNDHNENDVHDGFFDEIIEEITVEDNDEKDDNISVATNDEYFKNKACIEVEMSQDFVNIVETGKCDEYSYDEITADDCDYDEKTVDDEALQEDQEEDIELKEVHEEEVEVKTEVSTRMEAATGHEYAGQSDSGLNGSFNLSRYPKEKLPFETKPRGNSQPNEMEIIVVTSPISSQTTSTPQKTQNNRHTDSSKVEKLNPRITTIGSGAGKLAEKLKMFNSPKSVSAQSPPIIPNLSWEVKSSNGNSNVGSKKCKKDNSKTPVILPTLDLRSKQGRRSDEKSYNKSGCKGENEALVEELILLVKKPDAMQNKHALARRITSLLIGQSKETLKIPTLNQPYDSPASSIDQRHSPKGNDTIETKVSTPKHNFASVSSKIAKFPLPKSNSTIETNSYQNRKSDKFMDPGLKQMRKDVKAQKEKLKHVDDPATAENRQMKRISIIEPKQQSIKETALTPAFKEAQKVVDPEEIMARIWPKISSTEKCKPKSSSSSNRFSKNATPETQKITPSKLGNRLKLFESPSSMGLVSLKNTVSFEQKSQIESPSPLKMDNKNTEVDAESGINQVSKETIKRLLAFQRLWRTRKSERKAKTRENDVVASNPKAVCTASPIGKSDINPGICESSTPKPINPTGIQVEASELSTETTRSPSTSQKSRNSEKSCYYSLEELEQGNFDRSVVDMERWEGFLTEESFNEHFGLAKEDFYQQPKWKRDKQKRKVRVAF